MSDRQMVWVDVSRCTGCGACVEVCPVRAIALVNDKAHINHGVCTGCEACIHTCPEGALQPVVQGELVLVPERPAPTVHRPGPVAETAGAAVVATGVGLLARAAGALAQAVGRWVMPSSAETKGPTAEAPSFEPGRSDAGRGHRARRRRRGRGGSGRERETIGD